MKQCYKPNNVVNFTYLPNLKQNEMQTGKKHA